MSVRIQLEALFKIGKMDLVSTHQELSVPIIERIYKKMILKLKFRSIQVDQSVIIDGHHRYVASLLAQYELDQVPGIKSEAKNTIDWTSVKLSDEDWDTAAKVQRLNEQDARYNNMSLDELIEKMR